MRAVLLSCAALLSLGACAGSPSAPRAARKAAAQPSAPASASAVPVAEEQPPQPALDPLAPLPPGAMARCGTPRMRFARTPVSVALTNDGVLLSLEPGASSGLVVRDLARGSLLTTLPAAAHGSLSPDGSLVLLAMPEGKSELALHRSLIGELVGSVPVALPQLSAAEKKKRLFSSPAIASRWSHDGARLAVSLSQVPATYVLSVADSKLLRTFAGKGRVAGMDRSGQRCLLLEKRHEVFSSELDSVSVVEVATGRVLRHLNLKPPAPPPDEPHAHMTVPLGAAAFALAPDGTELLAAEDEDLWVLNVATGARDKLHERPQGQWFGLGAFGLFGRGSSLLVSPDGDRVAWDAGARRLIFQRSTSTLTESEGGLAAAFSPDGRLLATTTQLAAQVHPEVVSVPPGHLDPVRGVAFVADGKLLASGGGDLRFWDSRSCALLRVSDGQGTVRHLAAASSGANLVFDAATVRAIGTDGELWSARIGDVGALAVSPAGSRAAVASHDYKQGYRLMMLEHGRTVSSVKVQGRASSLAFAPSGTLLAAMVSGAWHDELKEEASLTFRDADTLEVQSSVPQGIAAEGSLLAFASDDEHLLISSTLGVSLYDRKQQRITRRFGWRSCCKPMAVSADGRWLAGASDDAVVVWEVATRRLHGVLRGHARGVESLAFSPDGKLLASGSADTTVLIWDLAQSRIPVPAWEHSTLADPSALRTLTRSGWFVSSEGKLALLPGRSAPKLPALAQVRSVAVAHAARCALLDSGKVTCWGSSRGGMLGTPEVVVKYSAVERDAPAEVPGLADVVTLSAGGTHACAVTRSGALWCWGALADPWSRDDALKRQDSRPHVLPLSLVTALEVGSGSACAVAGGKVHCWGRGGDGQLGNGAAKSSAVPVEVAGLGDATSVAVGEAHGCALRGSGAVACWGRGREDQLGDGQGLDSSVPVAVRGLHDAVSLSAGERVTCALRRNAEVVCWGRAWAENLNFPDPTAVPALQGATAIRVLDTMLCAEVSQQARCVK